MPDELTALEASERVLYELGISVSLCDGCGSRGNAMPVNLRVRGTGRSGPKFTRDVAYYCGDCLAKMRGKWRHAKSAH